MGRLRYQDHNTLSNRPVRLRSGGFGGPSASYQAYGDQTPATRRGIDLDGIPDITSSMIAEPRSLANEVTNQYYAHGGFMAAGPSMLHDEKWNRILKVLMPDVYTEIHAALQRDRKGSVIAMFENNPVVAAYGLWETKRLDDEGANGRSDRLADLQAIEWDVFLPDDAVTGYEAAQAVNNEDGMRSAVQTLVSEMIIAHGTTMQTICENVFKASQYNSVANTAKTNLGGVNTTAWMDIFARALRLANTEDFDGLERAYAQERRRSGSRSADKTFDRPIGFDAALLEYREIFGTRPFGVVLDIKSRKATARMLKSMIGVLNERGIRVYAVGSFTFDHLTGLEHFDQTVNGQAFVGPRPVKYVHVASNVQSKVKNGEIQPGDYVEFNAGSLLRYRSGEYELKEKILDGLDALVCEHDLYLGVYVQEDDIAPEAVAVIAQMVADRPDTFRFGFGWGGLADSASGELSARRGTRGLGAQGVMMTFDRWNNKNRNRSSSDCP